MTDNTPDRELLPCPFCGEQEDLGDYRVSEYPEVICGKCGAHTHGDSWNTRADKQHYKSMAIEAVKKLRPLYCNDKWGDGYDAAILDAIEAIERRFSDD